MIRRSVAGLVCVLALAPQTGRAALAPLAAGPAPISQAELKGWLSYIASDELKGRATFSDRAQFCTTARWPRLVRCSGLE